MKQSPRLSSLPLTPLLFFSALGSCATTPITMATPTDVVQSSDEIAVSERSSDSGALVKESFKMRDYLVMDVDRKWDNSGDQSIGGVSAGSTNGGYSFGVKSGAVEHKGKCATQVEPRAATVMGVSLDKERANVICECAGPTPASLFIGADSIAGYRGTVRMGGGNYTLVPIFQTDQGGTHGTPLGYEIRGVIPAGAVEVSGKGRLWLNKTLGPDAKANLACLFAGLLLYKPPTQ